MRQEEIQIKRKTKNNEFEIVVKARPEKLTEEFIDSFIEKLK